MTFSVKTVEVALPRRLRKGTLVIFAAVSAAESRIGKKKIKSMLVIIEREIVIIVPLKGEGRPFLSSQDLTSGQS